MNLPRYPGIQPQKKSIAIRFTYKGVSCRESIKIPPTKSNIEHARRMREAIQHEIGVNTFDYARHFPDSKKALALSDRKSSLITVEEALRAWIIRKQEECAHSTIKDYNNSIWNYLIPKFGKLTLDEVKASDVKTWRSNLKQQRNGEPLSNKRKNNILIPLRGIFDDAYYDEIIERNPMAYVKNLTVEQREPEPFSKEETEKILNEMEGQERNYFQFAFGSGLRTSELIGLKWEDVDFQNRRLFVRRAVVDGKVKTTKTKSGKRTIELTDQALEALQRQALFTQHLNEWVFHDPKTNKRWKNENPMRKRVWDPALKRAGVKYRNPYQTRHTYASTMLMDGRNPMWLAYQMGHSDWGMIRKVYARWIVEEA